VRMGGVFTGTGGDGVQFLSPCRPLACLCVCLVYCLSISLCVVCCVAAAVWPAAAAAPPLSETLSETSSETSTCHRQRRVVSRRDISQQTAVNVADQLNGHHADQLSVSTSIDDARASCDDDDDDDAAVTSSYRQQQHHVSSEPLVKAEHLSPTMTSSAPRNRAATPPPQRQRVETTSPEDRKSRRDRKWTDSPPPPAAASRDRLLMTSSRSLVTSREARCAGDGESAGGGVGRGEGDGSASSADGVRGGGGASADGWSAGARSPLGKCSERPASLSLAIHCDNVDIRHSNVVDTADSDTAADSTGRTNNTPCQQDSCDNTGTADNDTAADNTGRTSDTPCQQDTCDNADTADSDTAADNTACVSSLGYELECITPVDEEPPASATVAGLEQSAKGLEEQKFDDDDDDGLSGLDVLSCVASSRLRQTFVAATSQPSHQPSSSSSSSSSSTRLPCPPQRRFSILDLPLSQLIDDVRTDGSGSGRGGCGDDGRVSPDVVTAGYNVPSAGDCPTVNTDPVSYRLIQHHHQQHQSYAGCDASVGGRAGASLSGCVDVSSSELPQRPGDVFTALRVDAGQ